MNRKGSVGLLVAVVVIGVVIVGGIWYYVSHQGNPMPSTITQSASQTSTTNTVTTPQAQYSITPSSTDGIYIYTNSFYGISFPFSSTDGSWPTNGYAFSYMEKAFTNSTATIQLGGDIELDNGQMDVYVNPAITDDATCKKFFGIPSIYNSPKPPYYPYVTNETINGVSYSRTETEGEASMTAYPYIYYFHTFTHALCYEIDIAIIQPSSLYDPSIASPLTDKQIEAVITNSLLGITYSSPSSVVSVSQ